MYLIYLGNENKYRLGITKAQANIHKLLNRLASSLNLSPDSKYCSFESKCKHNLDCYLFRLYFDLLWLSNLALGSLFWKLLEEKLALVYVGERLIAKDPITPNCNIFAMTSVKNTNSTLLIRKNILSDSSLYCSSR